MWRWNGSERPDFAETPAPGQESVWDYPRPPALLPDTRTVVVTAGDVELAHTRAAVRVTETASPPTWYLPPDDVRLDCLEPVEGQSWCEWKGAASYVAAPALGLREPIGWRYDSPSPRFEAIAGWVSFYPARVTCRVDGEIVRPQPGGFYGGWLTNDIAGPVKGEPGTGHW